VDAEFRWQSEEEGSSLVQFRLCPDPASVPLDDAFANREPNPRTFVLTSAMQALKEYENLVRIPHIESDPIIFNGKQPILAATLRSDMYPRRFLAVKLDSVGNQILQHLPNLDVVRGN
jgi:hypothetical protein